MREIEFRAWRKDNGEMLHNFMDNFLLTALNSDQYIIEQYTGLTDKNGVKIFEGDIIQVDDDEEIGYTFRGEKAEVYWQAEKTGFRIKYGEFQKNILLKEDTEFYTICGNIHQTENK